MCENDSSLKIFVLVSALQCTVCGRAKVPGASLPMNGPTPALETLCVIGAMRSACGSRAFVNRVPVFLGLLFRAGHGA